MLTVLGARKVLGKQSDTMSDEEVLKDIETAELFKEFFIGLTIEKKACHNCSNGKTTSSYISKSL
jgi:hypothetical protein